MRKSFVEWLSQYEFELVQLEGLPVVDQAKLFANVRIVLGPHGTGLTNIIFCRRGSTVIELMSVGLRDTFKILASIMSLNFIQVATCQVSERMIKE